MTGRGPALLILLLAAAGLLAQDQKELHVAKPDADGVQRIRIVGGSYFFKPGHIG